MSEQLSSTVVAHEEQTNAEDPQRNWARNFSYGAARWHYPETVEQIQEIVSRSKKVRALGSRHSFSTVADTTGDMISLEKFPHAVEVDRVRRTVTVNAGSTFNDVCLQLDREGFAFHNMGSLPHISIAGAVSTATHGSGVHNRNLASAVSAIEFVAANGELVKLSRDEHKEQFDGAVVGLGGLGIITKLTLDVVPSFAVRQYVYENLPWSEVEAHFDEIHSRAYSVSFFLNWNPDTVGQVWLKFAVDENEPVTEPDQEWFGGTLATKEVSPYLDDAVTNCTEQQGKLGAWYDRLTHFRKEFIPGKGEELQTEFFVPREHAVAAIRAVRSLRDQIQPKLFGGEIRCIKADDLWMSTAYRRDCVAIHFTWKPDIEGVDKLLPQMEALLGPFGVRPHWGKVFTLGRKQVQDQYPKLRDFQRLLSSYDPERKFQNAFLDKYIYPDP